MALLLCSRYHAKSIADTTPGKQYILGLGLGADQVSIIEQLRQKQIKALVQRLTD